MSERDLFSMWARGESTAANDEGGSQGNLSINSAKSSSGGSVKSTEKPFKLERENSLSSFTTASSVTSLTSDGTPVPMSDQDLFSQWARGESPANAPTEGLRASFAGSSMVFNSESSGTGKTSFFNSGTFMNVVVGQDDSDDDSVV